MTSNLKNGENYTAGVDINGTDTSHTLLTCVQRKYTEDVMKGTIEITIWKSWWKELGFLSIAF